MEAGDIWYGTAVLGTSPATPGDIGSFPVTIHRVGGRRRRRRRRWPRRHVGDTVDYEITIQPNVTDTDLVYTIVDTVPDGFDDRPGLGHRRRRRRRPDDHLAGDDADRGRLRSAPTWRRHRPTAPQCAENAGFLDLATLGIPLAPASTATPSPAIAFSNIGPFEQYGQQFPNLVVAEDGFVTVTGGYGGEPWVPQAIPDAGLPERRDRTAVVRPRAVGRQRPRDAPGLGESPATAWRSSSGTTPSSSPATTPSGRRSATSRRGSTTTSSADRPEMTFEYGDARRPAGARRRSASRTSSASTRPPSLGAGDPSTVLEERRDDLPRLRRSDVRPGHAGLQRDRRRRAPSPARTRTPPSTSPTTPSPSRRRCRPTSWSPACAPGRSPVPGWGPSRCPRARPVWTARSRSER